MMPGMSIILDAEKRTEQRKYVDGTGIFGRPLKRLKIVPEYIPIKRSVIRSDQHVFINPDNISDMTFGNIDSYQWWNKIHFEKNIEPPGIRNAVFSWGKDFKNEQIWILEIAMNNGTEFDFYYQDKFILNEFLALIKTKTVL
jgi:hypothetical protein